MVDHCAKSFAHETLSPKASLQLETDARRPEGPIDGESAGTNKAHLAGKRQACSIMSNSSSILSRTKNVWHQAVRRNLRQGWNVRCSSKQYQPCFRGPGPCSCSAS